MINVFTPKRISPDCPFKSNQRLKDFDFDSAVCSLAENGVERCYKYENTKNRHIRTSLTPQCASHRIVKLRGVHHTAESSSAVCITPRSPTLRCALHRGVKLRGVHHTEEVNCTLNIQNWNLCESLVDFKGNVSRDFGPPFFSWFNPIWAPDKLAKRIFEFGFNFAETFDHKVIFTVCCTLLRS